MSVHSEYQRALRAVQVRLAESVPLVDEGWLEQLEGAQLEEGRDLSAAARTSLALLARLEDELARPGVREAVGIARPMPHGQLDLLRDACHNLRAHCRAILGSCTQDP